MKIILISTLAAVSLALAQEAPVTDAPVAEEASPSDAADLNQELRSMVEGMVGNVTCLNEVLAGVTDAATADAAAPKVVGFMEKADLIQEKLTVLVDVNPDAFAILLSLLEENSSRMQEIQDALNRNIQRIMEPEEGQPCFGSAALQEVMGEMLPGTGSGEEELGDASSDEGEGVEVDLPPLPDEVLDSMMQQAEGVLEEVVSVLSTVHDHETAEAVARSLEKLSRQTEELFARTRPYAVPSPEKLAPYEEKLDNLLKQVDSLLENLSEQEFYECEALEEAACNFAS